MQSEHGLDLATHAVYVQKRSSGQSASDEGAEASSRTSNRVVPLGHPSCSSSRLVVHMSLSNLGNPSTFHPPSAHVLDSISETVAWEPDSRARAKAMCSLIAEMYETTAWVNSADPDCHELASLRHVLAAAADHLQRMNVVTSAGRGPHLKAAS